MDERMMNAPDSQAPAENVTASFLDNLASIDILRAEIQSKMEELDISTLEELTEKMQKVARALGELVSAMTTAPATADEAHPATDMTAPEQMQATHDHNDLSLHESNVILDPFGSSATYAIDVPFVYTEPPQPEPWHPVVDLLQQVRPKIVSGSIQTDNKRIKKKKRV